MGEIILFPIQSIPKPRERSSVMRMEFFREGLADESLKHLESILDRAAEYAEKSDPSFYT